MLLSGWACQIGAGSGVHAVSPTSTTQAGSTLSRCPPDRSGSSISKDKQPSILQVRRKRIISFLTSGQPSTVNHNGQDSVGIDSCIASLRPGPGFPEARSRRVRSRRPEANLSRIRPPNHRRFADQLVVAPHPTRSSRAQDERDIGRGEGKREEYYAEGRIRRGRNLEDLKVRVQCDPTFV
ncbi:hypothetical protein VTI74DRAFT_6979 [Chaetomium olivicolor]